MTSASIGEINAAVFAWEYEKTGEKYGARSSRNGVACYIIGYVACTEYKLGTLLACAPEEFDRTTNFKRGDDCVIYIGHFSFMEPSEHIDLGEAIYGYFTTIVEAEEAAEALSKFHDLLFKLHEEEDILDGVSEVYLDSCIECISIPDSGFLAHFKEWFGSTTGNVSTSIRGAIDEQAVAYFVGIEEANGADEECAEEPFISF